VGKGPAGYKFAMPEPTRITDSSELAAAMAGERFLLFKHSTACPVSSRAFAEYRAFLEEDEGETPSGYVDVIADKPLARWVAEETGVAHKSPQALLFAGGKVVWHESHYRIDRESLLDAIAAH
jgi:bacillithiol system protein YtxJ